MTHSQLDRLPVEIVHHLLGYFSAYEIFVSLHHVTAYIDAVLLNYSSYSVNFKSVTKAEFDLVCQCMAPDQVRSLTLSNDGETPGQVNLFSSRFQINQFTRLRSLTLIEIGAEFWEAIVAQVIDLKDLRSFVFIVTSNSRFWYTGVPTTTLLALDKSVFDVYRPALSQLNRLRLYHGDYLKSVHFPNLRQLMLNRTSLEMIQHISQVAPQLRSLETEFHHSSSGDEIIFSFLELKWLCLTITGATLLVCVLFHTRRK